VLDDELRVVAASRSFYLTFKVNRDETQGGLLFELGDDAWDIPKLRLLLGNHTRARRNGRLRSRS
jgi:hypothetical protein